MSSPDTGTRTRSQVVADALVVTLARPHRRNAVDRETALELDAALTRLEEDDALGCAILAAEGPVFCAGTDLHDDRDKRTPAGGEYGMLRRERTKPLIAAVDGAAVGGGFELVLACDLVVAGAAASFSLPETRRGVVATGGGLFRAAQTLPGPVVLDLLLTGSELSAARAHALGLVSRLCAAGSALETALDVARTLRLAAPGATRETLRAVRTLRGRDDQLGWSVTARAREVVKGSDEAIEGAAAFRERRQPSWASSVPAPAPTSVPAPSATGHGTQRRGRRIALSLKEVDAYLGGQRTCRVATAGSRGPHVAPLWFWWDGTSVWLNSVVGSQRFADLARDPRVALVVDDGDSFDTLRGVEVVGTAHVVGEVPRVGVPDDALVEVEAGFHAKYRDPTTPIPYDGKHAWLRIDTEAVRSWDFRKRHLPRDQETT